MRITVRCTRRNYVDAPMHGAPRSKSACAVLLSGGNRVQLRRHTNCPLYTVPKHPLRTMLDPITRVVFIALVFGFPRTLLSLTADEIVARSAEVIHGDWERAPEYDFCANAKYGNVTTTTAVLMLDGSPYYRLVARNGLLLSEADQAAEQSKYEKAVRERRGENAEEHKRRVAGYQAERTRNQRLLEEFTKAMQFALAGEATVSGRQTYVVRGKPRPGYTPASKETKVLSGMVGTIWVDRETYHWVKAEAEVTRPVAVVGFIATVDPGTRFELEEAAVDENTWLATHFSMRTSARVFFLFHRRTMKDESYFNYQPVGRLSPASCAVGRP